MKRDIYKENELYKRALIKTLKRFMSFLDKNDFNYWASDGTCLGAVRHKDIIPWDDDIDLIMPAADYYRLMNYDSELKKEGLKIISSVNSHIAMSFLKVVDVESTVWEQPGYPLTGVWIDVFPVFRAIDMSEINKKSEEFSIVTQKFSRSASLYETWRIFSPLYRFNLKQFSHRLIDVLFYRRCFNKYKQLFLECQGKLNNEDGSLYVCYYGNGTYVFEKQWFDEYVVVPFAETKIRIPSKYHEYLTNIFGDYMTPPPVDKQIPHSKLYVNLSKSISLDEVKRRLRQGIHFEP